MTGIALPRLREDLQLHETGLDADGQAGFVIEDALRNRYFRLPAEALRLLECWATGTVDQVSARAGVHPSEVEALAQFLDRNRLLAKPLRGWADLAAEREQVDHSMFKKLLHGYLSFRVPLFDPTRLLDAVLPLARVLASRVVVTFILLLGITGLYFVARQWDNFAQTFLDFFSPQGLVLYGLTLGGLKVFHEMGHGLTARHFGCRVPVMGIGFMVLTPMLYTEVSDAWRLKDKGKRFRIAAAGVAVEMMLACVALFLWAFLPDGALRSAAYFVCATAWIASLAVNLSPFMRFDGYHMLGDAIGMYNLAPRAFALSNWRLRRWLIGADEPLPEILPRGLARFLVIYAFGTMAYRLVLFSGIAALVYHMFPKLLGVPLAFVEIYFFMWLPVWREVRTWARTGVGGLFKNIRVQINLLVAATVFLLMLLPLDRSVSVPAIALPREEAWIYAPEPARVSAVLVRNGQLVRAGEDVLRLSSDLIDDELSRVELRLSSVQLRLERIAADESDRAENLMLVQERQQLLQEISGLRMRQARLVVRAPVAGRVNGMIDGLRAGYVTGSLLPLLHIAGSGVVVKGLSAERDAMRVEKGAAAEFVAEDGVSSSFAATVDHIGLPKGEGPEYQYLSTAAGGVIGMAKGSAGYFAPVNAVLPVVLTGTDKNLPLAMRGTVTIEARPASLAGIMFRRVVSVALRESGF